jgi:tetrahydromethanopterin S-methyltransferase subunit G
MTETAKVNGARAVKVPEFLKEPLEAAHARLEQFEVDAERVLKDLMDKGRASRKEIEQIVARLSKQDWTLPEVKQRIGKLREQGVERATELRGRAETFRAEAMERVVDLQGRAIAFLGVASRDQVEELSKELDRLSRKIAKSGVVQKKGRKSPRPSAEV